MAEHACGFLVRAAAVLIVWETLDGGQGVSRLSTRLLACGEVTCAILAQKRSLALGPGLSLVAVQSQVKSGKSTILGATIASAISDDPLADFLGIEAAAANGKAIVHFDTEQGRYDAHELITRALRRAVTVRPPPRLRSYCLTDVDSLTRRRLFTAELV